MEPIVSLVLITHNAVDRIKAKLNQIDSQVTSLGTEVLVIDDSSTDGTADLIKAYKFKNSNRLIFNKENMGIGNNRNIALREAKGDFVCFFDDDDTSPIKRVETQMRSLLQAPDPKRTMSICGMRKIYSSGGFVIPELIEAIDEPEKRRDFIAKSLLGGKTGIRFGFGAPTCVMLIPRKFALACGSFDPNLRRLEDLDFTIRFLQKGGSIKPVATTAIERQMIGKTTNSASSNLDAELTLLKRYAKVYGDRPQVDFCSHWIGIKCAYLEKRYFKLITSLIVLSVKRPFQTIYRISTVGRERLLRDIKSLRLKK